MIEKEGNLFHLQTKNTSYIFRIMPSGHLEHLYYGARIKVTERESEAIWEKNSNERGNALVYSKDGVLCLEDTCLEMSGWGKGDVREPFIEIQYPDGTRTSDFLYEQAIMTVDKIALETLPSSYLTEKKENEFAHLKIVLKDQNYDCRLILHYTVFEDCDAIVRSTELQNYSKEELLVERFMSNQLDIDHKNLIYSTFNGHWAREMQRHITVCDAGRHVNESVVGVSSNRANPFVMLSETTTTEEAGECIGFNLLYSANHYESVEVSGFGKTRFISGIQPTGFIWHLGAGEKLESPEAVMVFSKNGFQGMSLCMHEFVREHIVRGEWKKKERPVLLNSWEANYFHFNESSLCKLAKVGKDVGIELFVMDDGWFGSRNDDTSSLGDWSVNTKKLPGGIKGLADKINAMGMLFGLWVEPEMVNENSKLYQEHPDWAVAIPGREQSLGRHQMFLDLTREEVQDYIIEQMSNVFGSGNISYVKWDMNRIFSDVYSESLGMERQGEFSHRYVMGLYRVMDILVKRFPHILFEGCGSGGNRFDLGMLCYMPQIWASDDTDALMRADIQNGYSYGYPTSVIGAHVSNCPNHQTLRVTPLETRFQVASFGLLGYECNLCDLKPEEVAAIKVQIALYKKYRKTLQFGDYFRLEKDKWMMVSKDKTQAVGAMLQRHVVPNYFYEKFRTKGLDDSKQYHFTNRLMKYEVKQFGDLINMIAPIHIKKDSVVHNVVAKFVKMDGEIEDYELNGSILNNCGVKLQQGFGGTGYNNQTRLYSDYFSRMYFMDEIVKGGDKDGD